MIGRSLLVVMMVVILGGLSAPMAPAAPPNVIFILADDLGCFELGCYGQKRIRTPNIDRLAAEGVRFTRFYAGNAVCAPSRCCLMTGKHPGHAAVRDNREVKPEGQHPLPAAERTIAEVLKTRGYRTAAMGKWGLGPFGSPGDPLTQGFDSFFGYNCQRHAHTHYPTFLYRNAERFELPGNDGAGGPSFTHDLFETEALAFLETHKAKPFFLFLPVTVPHVAIQVPDDALREYTGQLGDDPPYDGTKGYRKHPAPHAGYAAMVSRLDRTVGRILAKLDQLKLAENTLVVFTSDNGATHNVGGADSTFFESAGKLRGLKGSLYEGGLRVPFIARWRGTISPATTCNLPFAFWDVFPTISELAGADPSPTDGLSFAPTLRGTGKQPRHDFLYWEFPGYGGQQAVQFGRWKAVRQQLAKTGIKTELYDLHADEAESTNLAEANPEVIATAEKLFREQHAPSDVFPLPRVDHPMKK